MQRQAFIRTALGLTVATMVLLYMFHADIAVKLAPWRNKGTPHTDETGNQGSLFSEYVISARKYPFPKEKRFPVVKKKANPAAGGKFQTGVYLKFNTSKYTDMDGRIFIPDESVVSTFTFEEVKELYFRYIENIQITCPRMRHIGNDEDGGYHVCEPLMPNDCLAYSFGSRRDYTFDDGLVAHYNCEVHTFDPGDAQPNHQHGELVEFHNIGIEGKDFVNPSKMTLKTLDSIRVMLNHTERPLDLLKIDTEGAEWPSLVQMLELDSLTKARVKILIIEFHMKFTKQDLAAHLHGLRVLRGLYEAGFRIYYTHIWTMGCLITDPITHRQRAYCHEVHFLRT